MNAKIVVLLVVIIAAGAWIYKSYVDTNPGPPTPDRPRADSRTGPVNKIEKPKPFASGGQIEGMWLGTLRDVPKLGDTRVLFNIRAEADGTYSATVDSIDQGVRGIPVNDVKVDGDNINMTVNLIKGKFEGKYSAGGIIGKWTQESLNMDLALERVTEAPPLPTPTTRKEIAIDPAILDDYLGQYALGPKFSVTISREGNQLWQQASGQQKFEIYPEAKDKFFLKVVDAQYVFTRDASGKVDGLVLHQAKAELPAKKIR